MIHKADTKTFIHTFTKRDCLPESLKNAGVGFFLIIVLNNSVLLFSFKINFVTASKASTMLDFMEGVASLPYISI